KRHTLTIPLTAQQAGQAGVTIRLANAAGQTVEQALSLPVRPAAMPVTTRSLIGIARNGGKLTIDRELLAASLIDGATVSVG
ncbi:hypothetical protein AB4144_66570, partial [Rhizobiaceae sp. 2RAB30]